MKILRRPDPFLSRRAAPLGALTRDAVERIEEMFSLMRSEHGVGLAATQVGWDARVFVMNEHPLERRTEDWDMAWIDPTVEVVGAGKGKFTLSDGPLWVPFKEGCLSCPGLTGGDKGRRILRARHVRVRGIGLARADRGPRSGRLCLLGDEGRDPWDGAWGAPFEWEFLDRLAFSQDEERRLGPFIVQHEIDHLDGITIADREEAR